MLELAGEQSLKEFMVERKQEAELAEVNATINAGGGQQTLGAAVASGETQS